MERIRVRIYGCVAALVAALPVAAADHTREIVREGDLFGGPATAFSSFIAPSINNAGAVVFNARLGGADTNAGNNSGVFRLHLSEPLLPVAGGITAVLREGTPFQTGLGELIPADLFLARVHLEEPVFDLAVPVTGKFDAVAVQVRTSGGLAAGDSVIVIEELNVPGFSLAGAEGEDVPNGNGSFRDLSAFNLFGIGVSGEAGFFAALNSTNGGATDDTALYRYDDGVTSELVREGDARGGATLSGVFSPRMNRGGEVAFLGGLAGGDANADIAVFRVAGSGTGTARLATEGDAAPGGDGVLGELGELRINGAGDVAFSARLRNTDGLPGTPFAGSTTLDDSALYLARANGTLLQLAREGDEVSPGGARLGALADAFSGDVPRPSLNDDGAVAFRAGLLDVVPEAGTGIFIAAPDGLTQVARSGAAYDDGVFGSFEHPLINRRGMVAFKAAITVGEVNGEEGPVALNETALVVSDGIDFATVVREGDVLNGDVVFDIDFNADPTGPANGFDDAGRVAYQVFYASGARANQRVDAARTVARQLRIARAGGAVGRCAQLALRHGAGRGARCRAGHRWRRDTRPCAGHHAGLAERGRQHATAARHRRARHHRRACHRRRRERRGWRLSQRARRQSRHRARHAGPGVEREWRIRERRRDTRGCRGEHALRGQLFRQRDHQRRRHQPVRRRPGSG